MSASVTIVVSPRERFSHAIASLDSIFANTTIPFELIYIDGNSPAPVKSYVEQQSKEKGFKLIRTDHFLRPNQARNMSLPHITTDYAVFVDNDLEVTPGWLASLVNCAEETDAWVVGPLYLEGQLKDETIHMYGGKARITELNGKRRFLEQHRLRGKRLADVSDTLVREKTETVEFHCALVRVKSFEITGSFDPNLKSMLEHVDYALTTREAGGDVYVEPSSVVAYVTPPPFELSDLRFFLWRWSDDANRASLEHFRQKWNLPKTSGFIKGMTGWGRQHRMMALQPVLSTYRKFFPKRGGVKAVQFADFVAANVSRLLTSGNPA